MFRCNLPPALLAERQFFLSYFCLLTYHCGNKWLERTPNGSQDRKYNSGEENCPAAPGN